MPQQNPKKKTILRKPLLTAILDPAKSTGHIEVKKIALQPGQATGLHLHPCPVAGYIAKGSAYFEVAGEPARALNTGEAFFKPANVKILHFDNASQTEPMTFIAFYLLAKANAN
jgi:quercetin dioxygenase-like cupin family protein